MIPSNAPARVPAPRTLGTGNSIVSWSCLRRCSWPSRGYPKRQRAALGCRTRSLDDRDVSPCDGQARTFGPHRLGDPGRHRPSVKRIERVMSRISEEAKPGRRVLPRGASRSEFGISCNWRRRVAANILGHNRNRGLSETRCTRFRWIRSDRPGRDCRSTGGHDHGEKGHHSFGQRRQVGVVVGLKPVPVGRAEHLDPHPGREFRDVWVDSALVSALLNPSAICCCLISSRSSSSGFDAIIASRRRWDSRDARPSQLNPARVAVTA